MKKIAIAATLLSLLMAGAAQAKVWDFTFVGSTYAIANGTFTTSNTANVDGTHNITSASGTLTSTNAGLPQGAFTLLPGNGTDLTTPDGTENYSNLYTPGAAGFADQGIALEGIGLEISLYDAIDSGYTLCPGTCASVPEANGALYNPGDAGVLTITAVPEPATWAMMLLGVGLIGGGLRMARRKDEMTPVAA